MTPCPECGAARTVYDRICDCGALVHAAEIAELEARARIGRMAKDPAMERAALVRITQLAPEGHPRHDAAQRTLDAVVASPAPAPGADGKGPASPERGANGAGGPPSALLVAAGVGVVLWLVYAFLAR